jgi:hypothetical protein
MAQKGLKGSPEQMQQQSARRESHPASAPSLQGGLHPLLQLQRTIGNRAVARLLQAKLAVSHPGDPYEREADRVAEQVTSMSVPESTATAQRQMIPDEGKDTPPLQTKPLAASLTPLAQQQAMPEEEQKEEQPGQMQSTLQRAAGEESVDAGPSIEQQLGQSSGPGSPLPESVRSYMEPRFGADFSGVRVHTGSDSTQLNRSLSAQAFTVGQDIYYGGGKSPTDLSLTAHELTHVMQQGGEPHEPQSDFAHAFQGGLPPIHQLQGMLGNKRVAQLIQAKRLTPEGKVIGLQRKLTVGAADDQYEQEADRVARQVMESSRPPKSAGIAPPHRSHLMQAAGLQSRQNRIAPGAIYVQRQPAAAPVPVQTTDVPYPPARPSSALPSRPVVVVAGAAPPATEQMPDLGIDATAEFWGIPEVGPYVDQLVAGWQSRLAAQGKTVDVASTRASLVTDFDETMQGWYHRSPFFGVPWASLEQRVLQLLARERQRLTTQATSSTVFPIGLE